MPKGPAQIKPRVCFLTGSTSGSRPRRPDLIAEQRDEDRAKQRRKARQRKVRKQFVSEIAKHREWTVNRERADRVLAMGGRLRKLERSISSAERQFHLDSGKLSEVTKRLQSARRELKSAEAVAREFNAKRGTNVAFAGQIRGRLARAQAHVQRIESERVQLNQAIGQCKKLIAAASENAKRLKAEIHSISHVAAPAKS